jgi:hypothetical protein
VPPAELRLLHKRLIKIAAKNLFISSPSSKDMPLISDPD